MPSADSNRKPLITAIAAAIRSVPRGKVSTYGAVAKAVGYPQNARLVGWVLKQFPGLPWQRILGSGGRIAVPREYASEQRFLLEAEGVRFRGRRVDLAVFEHKFQRKTRPASRKPKSPAKRLRPKL
jgi:methylated-DNA-protein-cysteine methyltransferase-like protein